MPQSSSAARLILDRNSRRPLPENTPGAGTPLLDADELGSRIRADRAFAVPSEEVLRAWTSAPAWQFWMRLRSKSRATLAECPGGSFRLEVAESSLIHVITGEVTEMDAERFSLSWSHHGMSDRSSIVTVTVTETPLGSTMSFVHERIGSRREASWLMRFWSTAHRRLGDFVSQRPVLSKRPHEAGASAVWYMFSSSRA